MHVKPEIYGFVRASFSYFSYLEHQMHPSSALRTKFLKPTSGLLVPLGKIYYVPLIIALFFASDRAE